MNKYANLKTTPVSAVHISQNVLQFLNAEISHSCPIPIGDKRIYSYKFYTFTNTVLKQKFVSNLNCLLTIKLLKRPLKSRDGKKPRWDYDGGVKVQVASQLDGSTYRLRYVEPKRFSAFLSSG